MQSCLFVCLLVKLQQCYHPLHIVPFFVDFRIDIAPVRSGTVRKRPGECFRTNCELHLLSKKIRLVTWCFQDPNVQTWTHRTTAIGVDCYYSSYDTVFDKQDSAVIANTPVFAIFDCTKLHRHHTISCKSLSTKRPLSFGKLVVVCTPFSFFLVLM